MATSLRQIIGANVRARRAALGLSQEALAAEIGCERHWVSKFELGQRSIRVEALPRLERALRIENYKRLLEQGAFIQPEL